MAKRKKRDNADIPEVLRRLFKDTTQTLFNAIISLVPNSMCYLLRPDDPPHYQTLLNESYVVFNHQPSPLLHFSPDNHWSQHQIVTRVIEMMLCHRTFLSNVICIDYLKGEQSSYIVELLTTPAWDLLLKRVGDSVMIYLLENTWMFLSVSRKKHHQVAGPGIIDLTFKKIQENSVHQHSSDDQFGSYLKRKRKWKRVDDVCSMCKRQQAKFHADKHPWCNYAEMGVFDKTGAIADKYGEKSDEKLQQNSDQGAEKSRKRFRLFSCQRRRIRKLQHIPVSSDQKPCSDAFESKVQEKCSCLLSLKPFRAIRQRELINRGPIFYSSKCCSTVLPQKHILNYLKPSRVDSQFLIKKIFASSDENLSGRSVTSSSCRNICLTGSSCLYQSLVKLLKNLIRRFRKCQHEKLLDKHCAAVPSLGTRSTENSSSVSELSQGKDLGSEKFQGSSANNTNKFLDPGNSLVESIKPCSKNQVVSFVWAVCRSIIPSDLLGTPKNWRVLRRNIFMFIGLRRFEKISTKQCMKNLKTSMLPFLSDKYSLCLSNAEMLKETIGLDMTTHKECGKLKNASHVLKCKLLTNWIYWFFSNLIVPLVQANFYVTESDCGKQDILYYRKSVWKMFADNAITCWKDFKSLADVKSIIAGRPFGFSKLRICPKVSGVRMLANLKSTSRILADDSRSKGTSQMQMKLHWTRKNFKFDNAKSRKGDFLEFKSVNSVLRETHAVLKGLFSKEHAMLGSSVFDYYGVYRKLCPFLIGLKNGMTDIRDVFIVVSDVSKAFDSVYHHQLLGIVDDVIMDNCYILNKIHQIGCTKKFLRVRENLTLDKSFSHCTKSKPSSTFHSLHSITVNQGRRCKVKREKMLFYLKEHVTRNVLQFNGRFFLQGIGIPQGSVLSSLLCSLYYGDMEKKLIYPFLEKTIGPATEAPFRNHDITNCYREDTGISCPRYLLLRFIDDFIFISTSKEQATGFYNKLDWGFPEYNCYMNEKKLSANFDTRNKTGFSSKRVYVGKDGIQFLPWCGLFINCRTLEVQGDYTRYWNNHLRSTLTVCWQGKPDLDLKMKLQSFMRPKCHPIFFDSNINSAAVVRLNIYQILLLCAMKFHCYVVELSFIWKVNTRSYLKIIENSFRYILLLIQRRMQTAYLGPNIYPILLLEDGEVEWLGLNAYIQVLKRKQSRHKELLVRLRSKLLTHRITGNVSHQLKYAIDRSHSTSVWNIKY